MVLTQVLVERLVDDLDDVTETLDFSYRGVDYQVSLSAKNARTLDKLLAPYLEVSREGGKRLATGRPVTKTPSCVPVPRRSEHGRRTRASRSPTEGESPLTS